MDYIMILYLVMVGAVLYYTSRFFINPVKHVAVGGKKKIASFVTGRSILITPEYGRSPILSAEMIDKDKVCIWIDSEIGKVPYVEFLYNIALPSVYRSLLGYHDFEVRQHPDKEREDALIEGYKSKADVMSWRAKMAEEHPERIVKDLLAETRAMQKAVSKEVTEEKEK